MRIIMIVLAVLFSAELVLGQQSKPEDPDQARQLANPVTRRQMLQLPRRDKAPELSLQRALKIAEAFIKKQNIDISTCYLFEAKLTFEQPPEKSSWAFWWVNTPGDNATTNDVRITVTMDGRAWLESRMINMTRPTP